MKQNWSDYERSAEKGPFALAIKVVIGMFALSVFIGVVGYGIGWFGEAATVVREEFGPRAILEKYEWFKDAAAQLDKKRADIKVYDARINNLNESYGEQPRRSWAREDREQYNVWMSEVAGVKASYNTLAAEYNAQMVKFNWRFTDVGDLPQGATEPLPREFKPYVTN